MTEKWRDHADSCRILYESIIEFSKDINVPFEEGMDLYIKYTQEVARIREQSHKEGTLNYCIKESQETPSEDLEAQTNE
jgi:hypothetical protein